jgi:hypothetical protein
MNDVFAAAVELQRFCEERQWRFCFIGGIAVQRWGEPRLTKDADLTLLTGFGSEELFVQALLSQFAPRRPDAVPFALAHRVLLIESATSVPLDVALAGLPFEGRTIDRSSNFGFPTGDHLTTCSAEDLAVHKCFANREKDWLDVDGILSRRQGKLDLDLIRTELRPLAELKEQPEIMDRLEKKIAQVRRPFTKITPARQQ